ncbi:cupin domain-containing protein [Pseudonocardia sp. NPDC049154]|uniref:cupin domain-containing protein n=1 Tax=Pseudonocardia sp. NPDC049154 TaxID=3155501 RepID=UPI00340AEAD3
MIEEIRRAITGQTPEGKSTFTDVGIVPPTTADLYPGATYWLVWGTEGGELTVGRNDEAVQKPFFPGPGGSRLIAVRFAPNKAAGQGAGAGGDTSPEALEAMRADAEEKFPGLFDKHAADPEDAAFHTTDTVDYGFVVEGEIHLQVDGGEEQRLPAGSFVMQRGTRHAWINRSDEPALVVYVLLGARRVEQGN